MDDWGVDPVSVLTVLSIVSSLVVPSAIHGLTDEVAVTLLSVCGQREASEIVRDRIVSGLDAERKASFEEELAETMAVARHTPCAPAMHLRAIGIARDLRGAVAR